MTFFSCVSRLSSVFTAESKLVEPKGSDMSLITGDQFEGTFVCGTGKIERANDLDAATTRQETSPAWVWQMLKGISNHENKRY